MPFPGYIYMAQYYAIVTLNVTFHSVYIYMNDCMKLPVTVCDVALHYAITDKYIKLVGVSLLK